MVIYKELAMKYRPEHILSNIMLEKNVSAPAAYRVDPAARMTSSCPGGASPFAESSCNSDEVKDGTAVPEICRVLVWKQGRTEINSQELS